MAQILPHLLTMIHSTPDGAIQGSAGPATILTWARWGCSAPTEAAGGSSYDLSVRGSARGSSSAPR